MRPIDHAVAAVQRLLLPVPLECVLQAAAAPAELHHQPSARQRRGVQVGPERTQAGLRYLALPPSLGTKSLLVNRRSRL